MLSNRDKPAPDYVHNSPNDERSLDSLVAARPNTKTAYTFCGRALVNPVAALRAELLQPSDVEAIAAPWNDLASDAAEQNPFFETFALIPALKAYATEKVRIACVWRGNTLLGLVPVERTRGYANMPVAYWATWLHPHCYYGAPLIRRGHTRDVFTALFELLCDNVSGGAFFRLRHLDGESPLCLSAFAAASDGERLSYIAGAYERAVLFSGQDAETFLATNLRKKKRKELHRLRRRMTEEGELDVRMLTDKDDAAEWVNTFLKLEAKSWKGENGTALIASERDREWFCQSITGALAAGKLHFMRIMVGDRTAAMLASLLSGGAGFTLKICHEPEFARFSPGVLAEIEATKAFLSNDAFSFADSCAAPNHPMIDSLWRDRRAIVGVNVSGRKAGGRAALSLCRALESLRTRVLKPSRSLYEGNADAL